MPAALARMFATCAPFVYDFATGAATTVVSSVAAFALGTLIGVLLLVVRQRGGRVLAACVVVYVSLIRGTPALIQMLVAYYVLPAVFNIPLAPLPAGILALALNTAAYISEILR